MIRIISNEMCPCIKNMNDMVGKEYKEYEYIGIGEKYVKIENEYIFFATDVISIENEEDEQFRRSLLD